MITWSDFVKEVEMETFRLPLTEMKFYEEISSSRTELFYQLHRIFIKVCFIECVVRALRYSSEPLISLA